jgi:hypothetical protein
VSPIELANVAFLFLNLLYHLLVVFTEISRCLVNGVGFNGNVRPAPELLASAVQLILLIAFPDIHILVFRDAFGHATIVFFKCPREEFYVLQVRSPFESG